MRKSPPSGATSRYPTTWTKSPSESVAGAVPALHAINAIMHVQMRIIISELVSACVPTRLMSMSFVKERNSNASFTLNHQPFATSSSETSSLREFLSTPGSTSVWIQRQAVGKHLFVFARCSASHGAAKYIDLSVSAAYGSATQPSEHPASQPVRRQYLTRPLPVAV